MRSHERKEFGNVSNSLLDIGSTRVGIGTSGNNIFCRTDYHLNKLIERHATYPQATSTAIAR
jgi:hypothetical protein